MTRLLLETSVLIKWFHSTGEAELAEARMLRSAHLSGDVDAYVLDLAMYEMGNVLVRALQWPADAVADQLDDLLTIFGTPLVLNGEWLRGAASIASDFRLSFYDAAWAGAARALGIPLISADHRLIAAGLAESPTAVVRRLQLSST